MFTPIVALTNESTVLTDLIVAALIPALQYQVSAELKLYWQKDCKLEFFGRGGKLPEGWWQLVILDNADQAGALGYHELTSQGTPLGKIFAKLDLDNGQSWTVTVSHELLEMLVDPFINWAAQGDDGRIYALEVGDPVEADALGYTVYGKLLSNFITPGWFEAAENFPPDFRRVLKNKLELAPGGYVSVYDSKAGWTQINAMKEPNGELAVAIPSGSRRDRRRIPKSEWKRSER